MLIAEVAVSAATIGIAVTETVVIETGMTETVTIEAVKIGEGGMIEAVSRVAAIGQGLMAAQVLTDLNHHASRNLTP